jgi:DNA-binding response OmpR family regulator
VAYPDGPVPGARNIKGVTTTILVVDDDPVIQKLLSVNFELEGYRVVTAGDGIEGLESIGAEPPDIVLLDVMMPRMDGLEVCRRLKDDPATAGIPVILLSAKAQATDISGGIDAGADDYITKPFDPLELLDKVAGLIGNRSAP